MSVKSVNGTFQLPSVFSVQRTDFSMQSLETYKDAYYSLTLPQREAVFSLANKPFCTKLNQIHMDLFRQDLSMGSQMKSQASRLTPVLQMFDFTGNEVLSPKKRYTLLNKDPLTELLSFGSDFLRNQRRLRSKCAYIPDLWHKLLDQSSLSWPVVDAVILQVMEFCFLHEFHASPGRPFDRVIKLHPSRDLELGGLDVQEKDEEEDAVMDEALLDSLNDALAKPSKAKAKKNKNKQVSKQAPASAATVSKASAAPSSQTTTPSPKAASEERQRRTERLSSTSSTTSVEWKQFPLPRPADVSVITKNTFLHYCRNSSDSSLSSPRRMRARTEGAIFLQI